MNDPVDVLIVGAGASGAAVAWSLADTKMHILCLEQGGWMNPAEYPSTGRDWEARFYGDYSPSPNVRARPEDYPINEDNSPIKVVNFNGVGGSTVMYTAHWPRLHPPDFRVKTLDGVADDWPIDYDTLVPFFEENDRMMGVSGLSGDPRSPLTKPPMPPQPMGRSGASNGGGTPGRMINSTSGRCPNGLANSSGLVGKNLMFQPYGQVYGYVEAPTDSNRAPPTCLWSKEFYDTDPSRGFVRGYGIQFGC